MTQSEANNTVSESDVQGADAAAEERVHAMQIPNFMSVDALMALSEEQLAASRDAIDTILLPDDDAPVTAGSEEELAVLGYGSLMRGAFRAIRLLQQSQFVLQSLTELAGKELGWSEQTQAVFYRGAEQSARNGVSDINALPEELGGIVPLIVRTALGLLVGDMALNKELIRDAAREAQPPQEEPDKLHTEEAAAAAEAQVDLAEYPVRWPECVRWEECAKYPELDAAIRDCLVPGNTVVVGAVAADASAPEVLADYRWPARQLQALLADAYVTTLIPREKEDAPNSPGDVDSLTAQVCVLDLAPADEALDGPVLHPRKRYAHVAHADWAAGDSVSVTRLHERLDDRLSGFQCVPRQVVVLCGDVSMVSAVREWCRDHQIIGIVIGCTLDIAENAKAVNATDAVFNAQIEQNAVKLSGLSAARNPEDEEADKQHDRT